MYSVLSGRYSRCATRTAGPPGASYPARPRARAPRETPCDAAARGVASDSLNFRWGYEWPTEKQWEAGQHHGLCWAPDPS